MLAALRAINAAKASIPSSSPQTTVDLHPSRPTYRGAASPMGIMSLEADPSFSEISDAGGVIEKHSQTHEVLDSYFLISGEIPRVTEWEKGFRIGVRFEDGKWVPDELIMDERFVLCHVKGAFPSPPHSIVATSTDLLV